MKEEKSCPEAYKQLYFRMNPKNSFHLIPLDDDLTSIKPPRSPLRRAMHWKFSITSGTKIEERSVSNLSDVYSDSSEDFFESSNTSGINLLEIKPTSL